MHKKVKEKNRPKLKSSTQHNKLEKDYMTVLFIYTTRFFLKPQTCLWYHTAWVTVFTTIFYSYGFWDRLLIGLCEEFLHKEQFYSWLVGQRPPCSCRYFLTRAWRCFLETLPFHLQPVCFLSIFPFYLLHTYNPALYLPSFLHGF